MKFLERLTNEWITHQKLIVAVDFDDTIFPFKLTTQEECDTIIDRLKLIQSDALLIIWTASAPDRYDFIRDYCQTKGLKVVAINAPAKEDLKYGTATKPYFNILIDDRAGMEEALLTLEKAHQNFKHELQNQ